jgi:hypothetical protein
LYPPKNKIEVKQLNNTIEEYSLKKKKTKGTDECSVKNPPTNSDSASCKSKGVLLVSANIDKKKNKNTGNKGKINHTDSWNSIIAVKFKVPVISIIIRTAELNINS